MTTVDVYRRRQLILVAALAVGPYPRRGRLYANCFRVLAGAMGRVGLWNDRVRLSCGGEPTDPMFAEWYQALIEMTRPSPLRPLLLHGGGNLALPAAAYFTCCHLTHAGRKAAGRVLAAHPEWRAEPQVPEF